MEDDLGAAEDERTIELSSIAAIYPEIVIDASDPYTATLDIPVTPENPLKIYFQASTSSAPPILPTPPTSVKAGDGASAPKISVQAAAVDTHLISHFPPLQLKITLPLKYPTDEPPKVELSSMPKWIPKNVLTRLAGDCERLWKEMGKDQVVYTYIDQLQQDAETAFNVTQEKDELFQLSGDLKLALLDYDLKMKRETFEKETFECGICLEPKKGSQCHRMLLCGHVFCVACLQDFYNNCISEGDVDNVKCLAPSCGKDSSSVVAGKQRKHDRTLNPSELLQIPLEQETVQRYVRLKRKKKLEADKNTVYCPRQWCQGAAKSKKHPKPMDQFNDVDSSASEPEEETSTKKKRKNPDDIPMSERLRVCEDCNFAFCSVCKKSWHGEFARCNPRRDAELNEEEKASLAYLQRFSTPCPTCNAPAQKTHGCNHMICFSCKTHFCYLCSAYLMPDNPYRHFNDFKSSCYMRLWELEQGDGADAGIAFEGGGGHWVPPEEEEEDEESGSDADSEGSLDDEDIADFGGEDFILLGDDEDTSEEDEPAPDQRRADRNMHIEIVNFAGNGANRRIELPERPRVPPPLAPDPPRRGRRGQEANRARRNRQEPNRFPALIGPGGRGRGAPVEPEPRNLPPAAPGQGNDAQLPPGIRAMGGLERFLELAQQDMEDEWDSDELEDDMPPPAPRAPRRDRRR